MRGNFILHLGSPPHLRGKHNNISCIYPCAGITPHLRENFPYLLQLRQGSGSPPHLRGNSYNRLGRNYTGGITPHLRGKHHLFFLKQERHIVGSPPHLRENAKSRGSGKPISGSPAPAGKTLEEINKVQYSGDHPAPAGKTLKMT